MNVYILECTTFDQFGVCISSTTVNVFATKELAEQQMSSMPKYENIDEYGYEFENRYVIKEHKVQGV
jgi:hypothetical protein